METEHPDTNHKQESDSKGLTSSNLYRRGLTPRNVSPEKRSRNIQIQCQYRNNIEKAIHHLQNSKGSTSSNEIDTDVIQYADDIKINHGTKRFIDINVVTDSTNQLLCGQCARETFEGAGDDVMKQFRKFVVNNEDCAAMVKQIDKFERIRQINKKRRINHFENKCKVSLTDNVVGISSDISLQCKTCTSHRYPMTSPRKKGDWT